MNKNKRNFEDLDQTTQEDHTKDSQRARRLKSFRRKRSAAIQYEITLKARRKALALQVETNRIKYLAQMDCLTRTIYEVDGFKDTLDDQVFPMNFKWWTSHMGPITNLLPELLNLIMSYGAPWETIAPARCLSTHCVSNDQMMEKGYPPIVYDGIANSQWLHVIPYSMFVSPKHVSLPLETTLVPCVRIQTHPYDQYLKAVKLWHCVRCTTDYDPCDRCKDGLVTNLGSLSMLAGHSWRYGDICTTLGCPRTRRS